MNTVRIYGKVINRWLVTDEKGRDRLTQLEFTYRDVDENGKTVATGSEDFSSERLRTQTERRHIYTWDGQRRNKGGHRWFDYEGSILFRKSEYKELKAYLKNRYPNAEKIEARKK